MTIELAITDHRPELEKLKAATRARTETIEGLNSLIESPVYEAHGLVIHYTMEWKVRGGRPGWKGRWFIGWRPVGENQLFGYLRGLESGDGRFVPAWVQEAAAGG